MPIVGKRRQYDDMGQGYETSPMRRQAEDFKTFLEGVYNQTGLDILAEGTVALQKRTVSDALRNYFVNESVIEKDYENDPAGYEDQINMMNEQYTNDKEALLEYTSLNALNPVIGMTFPIHKNILMNTIYDKGAIPKVVAVSPKFTISMENRYIVSPTGEKVDIFKEQHRITSMMDSTAPQTEIELALPETGTTNILDEMGASNLDNVNVLSFISAVKVSLKFKAGEVLPDGTTAATDTVADDWLKVRLRFHPNYGELDRGLQEEVSFPANIDSAETSDIVNGIMKENRFLISTMKGIIKAVKVTVQKDTSNGMLDTCSVDWKINTTIEEIGPAIPLNVTLAPEEVKDVAALYQINQLTKVMSIIKLCLENYKDDKIRMALDDSFERLPVNQKVQANINWMPQNHYALDPPEWRYKTFFDQFDTHITNLVQILNDPNVTVAIFGRPDLIRKITPTDYGYTTPSNVGPIELDFVKTVVTSDKRVYQFMSSNKLRNSDTLTIILNPRNTERIIYRIYDYQMYISNEIRNSRLYTLPAMHAFERWKFVEYQPVQGKVTILNPLPYTAA